MDELVVRFLVNLPESERTPPRLFQNTKEAMWFMTDHMYKPGQIK